MSLRPPTGLHHITCVCGTWTATTSFYEALGFQLVKNTVNHDAPSSRHTYHADAQGLPGTTITFFEWPGRRGSPGTDSAQHVGLGLPSRVSLDAGAEALEDAGRPVARAEDLYGPCLETSDPDGLRLRLYETEADGPSLHHAALYGSFGKRRPFYEEALGLTIEHDEAGPARVLDPSGHAMLQILDGDPGPGRIGPGAVHHVALAVEDEDHQEALAARLVEHGHQTTEPVDRIYFRSVYTRDPAGHIIELATPGPGFAADEPPDALGQRLVLPDWLEDQRERIEQVLANPHARG